LDAALKTTKEIGRQEADDGESAAATRNGARLVKFDEFGNAIGKLHRK